MSHLPRVLALLVAAAGCSTGTGPAEQATEAVIPTTDPVASPSPARVAKPPFTFTDMTAAAGVTLRHVSGTSAEKPFPAANGSGCGAIDFDRDGLPDLCFATGRPLPIRSGDGGPETRLLWNRGHWQFDDITGQSRFGFDGYSAGVAVGDFDGDGFPDVFFNCYGRNALLHNQGDGTFREVAGPAGVSDPRWGTSAAFLDHDGDGLLDLFVCHYARWSLATNAFCGDRHRGIRVFCNPSTVEPAANVLFGNAGDGTFVDRTAAAGLGGTRGRTQGVVAADVDLDGHTDLYLANDLHPNVLFLGDGSGGFRDVSEESGATYAELGQSQAGMGVDAADLDGDRAPELFVTNFEKEHNALYDNRGGGVFQEVAHVRGLAAASLRWVGWGTALVDLDGDGRADVVVVNGHTDDNIGQMHPDRVFAQPAVLWHNRGEGRFVAVGAPAGSYFAEDQRHPGRGLAVADLDNDADPDLVVSHIDRPPALLRNERQEAAGLQFWLIGTTCNRDAVGSRVELAAKDGVDQVRQVKGGGSYLSAHDTRRLLACPSRVPPTGLTIEIHWHRGRHDSLAVPGAGCYAIIEGTTAEQPTRVVRLRHHDARSR